LSVVIGLFTKWLLIHQIIVAQEETIQEIPPKIKWAIRLMGALFIIGMGFLVLLFFISPIEIAEPFRLGRSRLYP
jgi:hypothetical protein